MQAKSLRMGHILKHIQQAKNIVSCTCSVKYTTKIPPWESEIEQHFCKNCNHAGVQFHMRATLFPKQTNWIRPAPGASGLRQIWQCGVPSSYEERQKKKNLISQNQVHYYRTHTVILEHRSPDLFRNSISLKHRAWRTKGLHIIGN
jgi:hypothetical protein